jgi:hypothetical protein
LNSKGERQEKRARHLLTRPEPTSNGNCISWEFIVGKNPELHSDQNSIEASLRSSNMNLSTTYSHFDKEDLEQLVGDLWITCGVNQTIPYRGVLGLRYIAKTHSAPQFYTKRA